MKSSWTGRCVTTRSISGVAPALDGASAEGRCACTRGEIFRLEVSSPVWLGRAGAEATRVDGWGGSRGGRNTAFERFSRQLRTPAGAVTWPTSTVSDVEVGGGAAAAWPRASAARASLRDMTWLFCGVVEGLRGAARWRGVFVGPATAPTGRRPRACRRPVGDSAAVEKNRGPGEGLPRARRSRPRAPSPPRAARRRARAESGVARPPGLWQVAAQILAVLGPAARKKWEFHNAFQ